MSSNETAANRTVRPEFVPGDFAMDEYLPIRVAVIGAGVSGIVAGTRYDHDHC